MKHAWMDEHIDSYPVAVMCELLEVSASGYYAARARAPSARARQDAEVLAEIERQQKRHRGRYGRRCMAVAVRRERGQPVAEKRIGRLMRGADLQSQQRRRRRVVTTDSRHDHPLAPNLLARDFTADAPNQKWLADITYVPTAEGWLYLALILDLFSRKFVGWAMSATMPQELTLAALAMALGWLQPGAGLMHHCRSRLAVRRR